MMVYSEAFAEDGLDRMREWCVPNIVQKGRAYDEASIRGRQFKKRAILKC